MCFSSIGAWADHGPSSPTAARWRRFIYPKESGYCAWAWNSGTAKTVKVGRECFPQDGYLGPPEFAKVQTPEEAYQHRPRLPPRSHSLRPPAQSPGVAGDGRDDLRAAESDAAPSKAGFWPFYCGIAIPHGDPAVLDI